MIPYITTSISNIAKVINSGLATTEIVKIDYLAPNADREEIPIEQFTDYLMHLNQSGIFANAVEWRFLNLFDGEKFLIEADINHNNSFELNAVIKAKNVEDRDRISVLLETKEE